MCKRRDEAAQKLTVYKFRIQAVGEEATCTEVVFIYDFAKRVLLHHLLRQPGQLRYVTGLKVDLSAGHI